MNLLFIGAGKMATALAAGMVGKQLFPDDNLAAVDVSAEARKQFAARTGLPCHEEAKPELLASADVILLAVKPQVAEAVVRALPPRKEKTLVISICAGVSIERLRQWLGSNRIVRVMPNTPLMVGKGASCYALSEEADEFADKLVSKILGALGKAWRVNEEQLDAVTALSGSGPAYFFEFIAALREGGKALGLPAEMAEELAVATMAGSVEMLQRNMGTPEELRIAVTSPGGTTAAALDVMGNCGFRKMVADLLEAARNRSVELGKM